MSNNNAADVTTWMPMYVSDFLVATWGWPADAVGHYTRMLFLQWDRGGLPSDIDAWEDLSPGIAQHAILLLPKFPIGSDGLRYNKRVEIERAKASELRTKRSEAGRQGAIKRWGDGSTSPSTLPLDSSSNIPPAAAPVTDRGARDARKAYELAPIHRQQGWKRFLSEWENHVVRQCIDAEFAVEAFSKYYSSPQGKGEYCRGPIRLVVEEVWGEDPDAWGTTEHSSKDSMAMLDDIVGGQ